MRKFKLAQSAMSADHARHPANILRFAPTLIKSFA